MSYALRFNGVGMEATFASPSALINIGTTADWEIEFKIKIPVGGLSTGSTTQYILGSSGSTFAGVYHRPAGGQGALAIITGGTFKFGSSAGMLLADDEFHTYRIYKATATGNNIYFERDGVPFGSSTSYSTSAQLTVGRFGRGHSSATTYWVFELDYAKYNNISGSSLVEWQADLANGSGTTLFTTDNSRNATIVNASGATDSWWVSYGAGGDQTVDLSTISSTSVLYDPSVTKDKLIELPYVDSGTTLYNLTVTKDKLVNLNTIEATTVVYGPSVTKLKIVNLDYIGPTVSFWEPSVSLQGQKFIGLPHIVSTAFVNNPSILKDKLITLDSIGSSVIMYAPSILVTKVINLDTVMSTSFVYDHEVLGGYTPIPDVVLYPAEGYGLHIRSAREMQEVIQSLAKRLAILEGRESP